MLLTQLATPALVVNQKVFFENLTAMEELLKGKTLRLRPHFKSNKCAAIAHLQLEHGAKGITCAKLSEAEDLADSGIRDILIANQIVDPSKIRRVAELAKVCHLTVCVDSEENIAMLSDAAVFCGSTITCYVEYDIGMRRCGVLTEEEALSLAVSVTEHPGLVFAGIQAYAGHVSHMETEEERRAFTKQYAEKLRQLLDRFAERGLTVKEISGGSTGTSVMKAEDGLYTELQAGSYLFLDNTYGKLDHLPFRQSLYVLSTVISKQPGLTVLDAGVKSLGMDQGNPAVLTMDGEPVEAEIDVNEEHLKLFNPSLDLPVGTKVLLIPGHCCSTVNLYEKLYFFNGDTVVDRFPITARGCSR